MSENESESQSSRKAGRQFLVILLGFFVVMCSVNAFFVYKAVSTHKGVVVENPYETGLKFNDIIDEARKREHERTSNPDQ